MAFDACMMRAVISEIRQDFLGAKIEKILQPSNDEVDLVLHAGKVSRRLVFNVGPASPRLALSDIAKENPPSAPMFCMYLRKHLGGARLEEINQLGFDRIALFTFSAYDELGYKTERRLVCEIMGKYANLILLDADDKIMNALKIIDFSASSIRQVLPGMKYQIPANQPRLSPLEIDEATFMKRLSEFPSERSVEKFITGTYSGIATSIAREIAYRACGALDTPVCQIDKNTLFSAFSTWQRLLIDEDYSPCAVLDTDGVPMEYSYMDITHLAMGNNVKKYDTLRELFDAYFAEKDRAERIKHRARDLLLLISSAISRTEKKLAIQRRDLLDSEKGEEYKRRGDLITANLYRLERGMSSFTAVDYYDDNCPEIDVPLDERLSPSQNAQKMYKLYNKSKTARAVLTEQIKTWEKELLYLESVSEFLGKAESEQDLLEIRDELYRCGYASRMRSYRPQKPSKIKLTELKTSSGKRILVGRNNTQNDYITTKLAGKDDVWFHVKDFPGSHVVLITEGEEPSDLDYTESAAVAAYYSKAHGDNVAVDYTRVKNIRKPSGSKPGFVTYKTNYTAYVRPSLPEG